MSDIHPTAVIDPRAQIGQGVSIGPFSVIGGDVVIGDDCQIAGHVVIKGRTTLGPRNVVDDGVALGGSPQHIAPIPNPGALVIGADNKIRENVTIHVAMKESESTRVGDQNLIMVNAHVAHDCVLGSCTILANNVMLAGHVHVDDYAYLSGAVGIHQFCRVGTHAMVGGQAHVVKDIPPYVTVDGQTTRIVGLNTIGLRRRGFSASDLQQLKDAYRVVYRQGLTWREVLGALREQFPTGPAAAFYEFFAGGKRGFTLERRTPPHATVPLGEPNEAGRTSLRRVG